jgi:hypothetical protein
MIGIRQEARRLHDSCHGSTPVPIKYLLEWPKKEQLEAFIHK